MKRKKHANRKPVVIAYDIQSDRLRTKVSKMLEEYGSRANKSVFECLLTQSEEMNLKAEIIAIIDKSSDSVLFYELCKYCYAGQWKTGNQEIGESTTFV